MNRARVNQVAVKTRAQAAAGKNNKKKERDGSKESKGKPISPKKDMKQVDKTFYELEIASTKRQLAQFRRRVLQLEEENEQLRNKIKSAMFEDEMHNFIKLLNERYAKAIESERVLKKSLHDLKVMKAEQELKYKEHISDLQNQYDNMHKQLINEVKLLTGKLNSLTEFQKSRQQFVTKYSDLLQQLEELTKEREKRLAEMEMDYIIKLEIVRRDTADYLTQLTQDIEQVNEINKAAYVRRLVIENVALRSEFDKTLKQCVNLSERFRDYKSTNKEANEECIILKDINRQLIKSGNNKNNIIEKLTKSYEILQTKYIELKKYRDLYEKLLRRCKGTDTVTAASKSLEQEVNQLRECIKNINSEKVQLQVSHNKLSKKLKVMHKMRDDIRKAITDVKDAEPGDVDLVFKRANLFNILFYVIDKGAEDEKAQVSDNESDETIYEDDTKTARYQVGNLGLVPLQRANFQRPDRKLNKHDEINAKLLKHMRQNIYIPKERENVGEIIDIEKDFDSDSTEFFDMDVTKPKKSEDEMEAKTEENYFDDEASMATSSSDDLPQPISKHSVVSSKSSLAAKPPSQSLLKTVKERLKYYEEEEEENDAEEEHE